MPAIVARVRLHLFFVLRDRRRDDSIINLAHNDVLIRAGRAFRFPCRQVLDSFRPNRAAVDPVFQRLGQLFGERPALVFRRHQFIVIRRQNRGCEQGAFQGVAGDERRTGVAALGESLFGIEPQPPLSLPSW